jgi:hypothetical protein
MAADASDSDPVHPTEGQRALKASLLGAALGAVLALLSRRRSS